jgi:hypothetical protein
MLTNLQFKLSRECSAFICLTGVVTQEAIQKLIALLEISKDTYPRSDELDSNERSDGGLNTPPPVATHSSAGFNLRSPARF